MAASAGVPLATLSAILGDNARTLEKYYVRINDDSKQQAIKALPDLRNIEATPATIDITPTNEADQLSKRISDALNVLKTAKVNKSVKKQLIHILGG